MCCFGRPEISRVHGQQLRRRVPLGVSTAGAAALLPLPTHAWRQMESQGIPIQKRQKMVEMSQKSHGKMFENFETRFFDEKNVWHVGNNEENPLENTSTRNTTVGSLRILVQKWWAHILVSSWGYMIQCVDMRKAEGRETNWSPPTDIKCVDLTRPSWHLTYYPIPRQEQKPTVRIPLDILGCIVGECWRYIPACLVVVEPKYHWSDQDGYIISPSQVHHAFKDTTLSQSLGGVPGELGHDLSHHRLGQHFNVSPQE